MPNDLLTDLQQRGIKLRLSDGQLRVQAPPGALTTELRERLRRGRDDLVALLRGSLAGGGQATITPEPGRRYEPFPLTDIQHAYWVGRGSAVELGGVSTHYYFELERAGLDEARLTDSLRKLIARHDMLRAVIRPDGQQQVLREVPLYQIPVADLRELPRPEREKELARIRDDLDHQVLPGDRWPLFDIRASRLDDRTLRLHVSLDVLILDGVSLFLLFREWRRFYEEPGWTPEQLSLTYRDYVLHEREARADGRSAEDERYWLDRLDSLPPPPALPQARRASQLSRTRFTRREARLAPERWSALKHVAQRHGLTPSAVLMTAFADVLRMWSGQPSLTLNLTQFNRPAVHPQINEVFGDFTSLILLAVDARPDESFAVRAGRLQQQLMRDLQHASYSGVRLLRERARRLGAGPSAAMPVVFTSTLILGSAGQDPFADIRFFGAQCYGLTQTPQVWLDHQVGEDQGALAFNWDAVEELFPPRLLDDMFTAYRDALDRLSDDVAAWAGPAPLASLPDWQARERDQANDTVAALPARTLCELVEFQASRHPDAPAVIGSDAELTYGETLAQGRRLARHLSALGATRNNLVAVVLDKGWRQVPALLGINLSGAAYLPVDPHWPDARRQQLLRQGGVRIAVTTPELRERCEWPPGIQIVALEDEAVRDADPGPLDTAPAPADLAYVMFTSGSTGQPKGVMIDHRGAANTIQDINARFRVGPDDRVLALSALSFDLSVYDIFGILAAGGAIVMPASARVHDPAHWTELAERHAVTVWNTVPALMQAWAEATGPAGAPASRLRLVLLSGDWIPVTLPDAVRTRHPDAELISLGGATEASIWSVCYPIGDVPAEWARIPYGKPLANQTLQVYDHDLEPCPEFVTGEIFIGGTGVAKGYWADAERTDERFIWHPSTGQRLYRTGDLGRYLPGGDIEFLGRADSQVKLNGHRIELGEIAAALRRQPGVAEAVVSVAASPATGGRQLVAYVVAEPATRPAPDGPPAGGPETGAPWQPVLDAGEEELRAGLDELAPDLAEYRRVWRSLEVLCPAIMARTFAQLGEFQRAGDTVTAAGTVGRRGLKSRYAVLISQWLTVLEEHGMLKLTGMPGEYQCAAGFTAAALDAEIRRGLATVRATGSARVVADAFAACAASQVELLRGRVSPLELLMPDGGTQVTDALYATNPVSVLTNRAAARVARCYADLRGSDQPLRVLEVGAGTGATTAVVLAGLPTERVSYRFTDVSTYFTERARSKFRAYPCVEYGVLDIDRAPAGQGTAPASADIIVAANVLHDAKDLGVSLRSLRSVLTPGGLLVAIEGTANSLLQMITVGFIEGLAQERDEPRLPLLPVPQWREQLLAAGFARFAAVPDGDAAGDAHAQHVLVGQAPAGPPAADAAALRGGLELLLPDYMVPRHYLLIDRLPLSPNGKVNVSALPPPWEEAVARELTFPRDEMERQLFSIWSDALQRDDFGVHDNFFELGADSLHAVRILGRLREEHGLTDEAEQGLEILFDHPTVAELAVFLRDRAEA